MRWLPKTLAWLIAGIVWFSAVANEVYCCVVRMLWTTSGYPILAGNQRFFSIRTRPGVALLLAGQLTQLLRRLPRFVLLSLNPEEALVSYIQAFEVIETCDIRTYILCRTESAKGMPFSPCSTNYCKLGLKSGKIPNHALLASSYWESDAGHHFVYGRLDTPNRPGLHIGAWAAGSNKPGQWIQVDLEKPTTVVGVITQGRNGYDGQWVTRYKIAFVPPNDTTWKTVKDPSGIREAIFYGNSDSNTKVTNFFYEPVVATKLRLIAVEWEGHISLRHEYLVAC